MAEARCCVTVRQRGGIPAVLPHMSYDFFYPGRPASLRSFSAFSALMLDSVRLFALSVVLFFPATAPTSDASSQGVLSTPAIGGVNWSGNIAPPPSLVLEMVDLPIGNHAVRIPTGSWQADSAAGAAQYSVPAPITAFRAANGPWRGHGYLETYPRLQKFTGTLTQDGALLDYQFDQGASYVVHLSVVGNSLQMLETSQLGPRNVWVFDAAHGWLASMALVADGSGQRVAARSLPCHYDQADVTFLPADLLAESQQDDGPLPSRIAIINPNETEWFACRLVDLDAWENPEQMGAQLWQRRQRPSDPASRHFIAPESKSDSTPNPRTAPLLGESQWEPHVTIEWSLGVGTRQTMWTIGNLPPERSAWSEIFLPEEK